MTTVGTLCSTWIMHRQIAGKLTGRVTKWVVAVLWIIIAGTGAFFGSKLSQVTDDFIAHLKAAGSSWDLDQTSEFIVVAVPIVLQ